MILKKIYQTICLTKKFLWEYHNKLNFHVQVIFMIDESALCCFLDDEFQSRRRDWYTRETWNVSLSDQIEYQEKLKIDEIKKKEIGSFSS